jgi:ABC-type branched-subunit amino acid transport system substrate-binding protein
MEVVGPYYTSAATDVRRRPSAADFRKAYAQRFPKFADYTVYTVEAYDAANVLIEALRRAGTPDRQSVLREVARTKDYAGASGSITFAPDGERIDPVIDFYVVKEGELTLLGATGELVDQAR